jgi:hypothetical protein
MRLFFKILVLSILLIAHFNRNIEMRQKIKLKTLLKNNRKVARFINRNFFRKEYKSNLKLRLLSIIQNFPETKTQTFQKR